MHGLLLAALPFCQVATEADLGLADAYINGYFSFADQREGLLNLLLVKLFFCSIV
jgi:cyclopropane-fatty-acyl-phospholipid synthase